MIDRNWSIKVVTRNGTVSVADPSAGIGSTAQMQERHRRDKPEVLRGEVRDGGGRKRAIKSASA